MAGRVIRIKPHHFIDILRDFGRGRTAFEPHPYGHAVHAVAERLWRDRDAVLVMELGADDICEPCVHNRDGRCDDTVDTSFRPEAPRSKQAYNLLIDRRWCQRLGLGQGDRLTARAFCKRLAQRLGDVTDIYRENPPGRVTERAAAIRAGIARFLGDDSPQT
ncbi:MAG: hypothetical protein ACODAJ_14815 [Planctomycetota bacterium]